MSQFFSTTLWRNCDELLFHESELACLSIECNLSSFSPLSHLTSKVKTVVFHINWKTFVIISILFSTIWPPKKWFWEIDSIYFSFPSRWKNTRGVEERRAERSEAQLMTCQYSNYLAITLWQSTDKDTQSSLQKVLKSETILIQIEQK